MSKPRKIGIFALLAVAIWCSVTTAFASEESIMGFQVILAEDEKADVFLTSIDFEFVDQHISNYPIFCFDVNEHGAYALGFNASKKLVNVYDTDGVFLYGCRFSCNGTYSIGISESNGLFIYFVRSNLLETAIINTNKSTRCQFGIWCFCFHVTILLFLCAKVSLNLPYSMRSHGKYLLRKHLYN